MKIYGNIDTFTAHIFNDVNRRILADRRDRRIRAFLTVVITAQLVGLVIGIALGL